MKKSTFVSLLSISLFCTACSLPTQSSTPKEEVQKTVSSTENTSSQEKADKKASTSGLKLAEDFTMMDLNGKEYTLSQLKGKKVFIKYWASWCHICMQTLPETEKLAAEENDFIVLSVVAPGVNGERNLESFTKWYPSLGHKNLPVLIDTDGSYMRKLGVRGFPSYQIINSKGESVTFNAGHLPTDKLKEMMKTVE